MQPKLNPYIEIGKIIRQHRLARGLTQLEVSKRLGHETPQFLSFMERGLSKAPVETLGHLIVILDIPEGRIMNILLKALRENLISEINMGKRSAAIKNKWTNPKVGTNC